MRRNRLGRSRGGYGTKAVVACDGRGLALSFALLCGQASELKAAPKLLDAICAIGSPGRVVCDRACSSKEWRAQIEAVGAEPCVPANKTHPEVAYDERAYKRRRHVENLWARLKENRAIATRYEKTAASYTGNLQLAAMMDWLSNGP
jgi:transposase